MLRSAVVINLLLLAMQDLATSETADSRLDHLVDRAALPSQLEVRRDWADSTLVLKGSTDLVPLTECCSCDRCDGCHAVQRRLKVKFKKLVSRSGPGGAVIKKGRHRKIYITKKGMPYEGDADVSDQNATESVSSMLPSEEASDKLVDIGTVKGMNKKQKKHLQKEQKASQTEHQRLYRERLKLKTERQALRAQRKKLKRNQDDKWAYLDGKKALNKAKQQIQAKMGTDKKHDNVMAWRDIPRDPPPNISQEENMNLTDAEAEQLEDSDKEMAVDSDCCSSCSEEDLGSQLHHSDDAATGFFIPIALTGFIVGGGASVLLTAGFRSYFSRRASPTAGVDLS